jgi:hypothetical protein
VVAGTPVYPAKYFFGLLKKVSGINENVGSNIQTNILTKRTSMEQKVYYLVITYVNTHSLVLKNSSKQCAYFELEARVEELRVIPGTALRITEPEQIKVNVYGFLSLPREALKMPSLKVILCVM